MTSAAMWSGKNNLIVWAHALLRWLKQARTITGFLSSDRLEFFTAGAASLIPGIVSLPGLAMLG